MIFTKQQIWVAVLIIGVALGIPIGRCSKPLPVIKTGVSIVHDSIVTHDTVSVKDSVWLSPEIKTVYKSIHDTVNKVQTFVAVKDTTPCYSISGTSPRGTYARAQLCSKLFPIEKPLDLSAIMEIKDASDTDKIITRIDTIERKQPFYKDWKTYAIIILSGIIATEIYRR